MSSNLTPRYVEKGQPCPGWLNCLQCQNFNRQTNEYARRLAQCSTRLSKLEFERWEEKQRSKTEGWIDVNGLRIQLVERDKRIAELEADNARKAREEGEE